MIGIAVSPAAVAVNSIFIMQNSLVIRPVNLTNRDSIIELLRSEKLPVVDLSADLRHFFMATDSGFVVGAIGLEIYERYGLLRSLVVKPEYRKMKVAAGLINEVEKLGKSLGLTGIYLLTETAQGYFTKNGYSAIDRADVPVSLQQSSEFSHVCPSSATVMTKPL
jgi:amino-acid N-acetyltransferase